MHPFLPLCRIIGFSSVVATLAYCNEVEQDMSGCRWSDPEVHLLQNRLDVRAETAESISRKDEHSLTSKHLNHEVRALPDASSKASVVPEIFDKPFTRTGGESGVVGIVEASTESSGFLQVEAETNVKEAANASEFDFKMDSVVKGQELKNKPTAGAAQAAGSTVAGGAVPYSMTAVAPAHNNLSIFQEQAVHVSATIPNTFLLAVFEHSHARLSSFGRSARGTVSSLVKSGSAGVIVVFASLAILALIAIFALHQEDANSDFTDLPKLAANDGASCDGMYKPQRGHSRSSITTP